MTVTYYNTEKSEHVTIKNVYSVLDDKDDNFVTVCFEGKNKNYDVDIEKDYITSITV